MGRESKQHRVKNQEETIEFQVYQEPLGENVLDPVQRHYSRRLKRVLAFADGHSTELDQTANYS